MTSSVNAVYSKEPELTTAVSAGHGQSSNKTENQSFSKTFAASLDHHSHLKSQKNGASGKSQGQSSRAQHSSHELPNRHTRRDNSSNSTGIDKGKPLPKNGKHLQQSNDNKVADSSSQSDKAATTQTVDLSNPANSNVTNGVDSQSDAGSAFSNEVALVSQSNGEAGQLPSGTESVTAVASMPLNQTSAPAASPVAGADGKKTPPNGNTPSILSPAGINAHGHNGLGKISNIPGLSQQDTARISTPSGDTPSSVESTENRETPGASAQQKLAAASHQPAQPLSDQVKQWFASKLEGKGSSDAAGAKQLSPATVGGSGSIHKPDGAITMASTPDDLRKLNSHLLFEKLLSQPGNATARSTAVGAGLFPAALSAQFDRSGDQDRPLPGVDGASQVSAGGVDVRPSIPVITNPAPLLPVPTPIHNPAWAQDVGHKLLFMLNQDVQHAQLQMNPRHLGPLEVRISLGHDQQVNVSFVTHNATARDAIDGAMPRLRDMLVQQGLNLNDFNVSQENASHPRGGNNAHAELMSAAHGGLAGSDELEAEDPLLPVHAAAVFTDRIVDYFA